MSNNVSKTEDPPENGADDIYSVRQRVVKEFEEFEKSFRLKWPVSWFCSLVGPFFITALVLVVVYFVGGSDLVQKLVGHAVLTFFVFGRLIILGGGDDASVQLPPSQLFFMVTYMDFMVAVFVAFHMGIVFRIPYVGNMIAEFVGDGQFLLKRNPWIRRVAFFGLVLFVIFPTSTTGSIGGSIFGRLLGLSRWTTVAAIVIGSVAGNGLMYLLSEKINQSAFSENIWIKWIGLVVLIGVFYVLERRYRAMKNRFMEEEKHTREVREKTVESSVENG